MPVLQCWDGGNYHGQITFNELHPVRLSAYSHSARNTLGENPLLATELQLPTNGRDEGITKLLFDDFCGGAQSRQDSGREPSQTDRRTKTQSGHTP
jgi:hypothetical protein